MKGMVNMRDVRSVLPMQTAKTGYIVISALLCILGVCVICRPDISTAMLGSFAGIVLIVFGIFKLIGYFSKDLYRLAFQFDLAFGILMLILGIVILTKPENLIHFMCIATGLYFTADGLMKLQTVRDSRSFGIRSWWIILIAAVLTCVLGIALMLRPTESTAFIMRLFGTAVLAEGLLNLATVLITVKIIRHQKPDIIEVPYRKGDTL
jgi:uncharacterized membrane protein HdeD (DUF308 family)